MANIPLNKVKLISAKVNLPTQSKSLRLAFVGKGGAGKSMICGTLARILARRNRRVLALDVDTMPGLAHPIKKSSLSLTTTPFAWPTATPLRPSMPRPIHQGHWLFPNLSIDCYNRWVAKGEVVKLRV